MTRLLARIRWGNVAVVTATAVAIVLMGQGGRTPEPPASTPPVVRPTPAPVVLATPGTEPAAPPSQPRRPRRRRRPHRKEPAASAPAPPPIQVAPPPAPPEFGFER